ncbi:MAG: hypothetical protein WDA16_06655, partial [Candidatus Thermoplasmatota archaeon]
MGAEVSIRGAHHKRRLPGLVGPIAAAVVADFVLDALLDPRSTGLGGFVTRVIGFGIGALLAVLIGMFLGKRAWPKRGRRLAAFLLRRAMKASHKPDVFLTDRPDFTISVTRRIVEVV